MASRNLATESAPAPVMVDAAAAAVMGKLDVDEVEKKVCVCVCVCVERERDVCVEMWMGGWMVVHVCVGGCVHRMAENVFILGREMYL